jgi:hypothetical protein
MAMLLTGAVPAGAASRTGPRAHAAVVGGTPIAIAQAPWTAFVTTPSLPSAPAITTVCTGEILDATHVLTAAHCAVDPNTNVPIPVADLRVRAGISNFEHPAAGDQPQTALVAAVRIHPGYVQATNPQTPADDVAVLQLAAPLTLSAAAGTTAEAIALAAPGTALPAGTAVGISGYGLESAAANGSTALPDGSLNTLTMTLQFTPSCDGAGTTALVLCATAPGGSPCEGDSGGALVTPTAPPLLVGVMSLIGDSPPSAACQPGDPSVFSNVTAPEIQSFITGGDSPPQAPRGGTDIRLTIPPSRSGAPEVGQVMTCSPGTWSGVPAFAFQFIADTTGLGGLSGAGVILQSGSSPTYTLAAADLGQRVYCVVQAANAGGTGTSVTADTPPIAPSSVVPTPPRPIPKPVVRPAALGLTAAHRSIRRGRTLSVRIVLRAGTSSVSRVPVCLGLPAGVRVVSAGGGRRGHAQLCWTVSLRAGAAQGLAVVLRPGRSGPLSLAASARLGGTSTVRATVGVSVTR